MEERIDLQLETPVEGSPDSLDIGKIENDAA